MFAPEEGRLFGTAAGVPFAPALVEGIRQRLAGPPEALARVTIFLPTARMRRAIRLAFAEGPPTLLPRLRLVAELADDPLPGFPCAVPPLRRRLELTQLVASWLEAHPGLAPPSAAFDLAGSLAALVDEMRQEGVPAAALERLHERDDSAHWQRSLDLVRIAEGYAAATGEVEPSERLRLAVEALAARWAAAPPEGPVLVAGSTGSRGTTLRLMEAVARLPQGALILPGFDFDLQQAVWERLDAALTGEDHPQFRYARLLGRLGLQPDAVHRWGPPPPVPARSRLVSLALRPAPVTDAWLEEGPQLADLAAATARMTLLEAPTARTEAEAIALRLRAAADAGERAALVTPDRLLARRVTAALARWDIEPDDSAGRPLALSAPGRLLRQIALSFGRPLGGEALLALLKHPLAATGGEGRGPHLRLARELELAIRRAGAPHLAPPLLEQLALAIKAPPDWAAWVAALADPVPPDEAPLTLWTERLLRRAEQLAAGPAGEGPGELWLAAAGRAAQEAMTALVAEAPAGGAMTAGAFATLLAEQLAGEVREAEPSHPDILILGTVEARTLDAGVVILGGLNEGIWPPQPEPDPWLNRGMRDAAGLLLPERRIGLSAHDFEQAIGAPEVILTRALRDASAETVPSRWLARLANLLNGLEAGRPALATMRARGEQWLALGHTLGAVTRVQAARRPSPQPPVHARPSSIGITELRDLLRDPFAVYARRILRLRRIDALRPEADPPLRGTVLHDILHRFAADPWEGDPAAAAQRLLALAEAELAASVPWPVERRIWATRLAGVAPVLVAAEARRRAEGAPALLERPGAFEIDGFGFRGRADRIDRQHDGRLVVYDYKTGTLPTETQMKSFEKQLLLEAAMVEAGAFEGLDAGEVAAVAYIGVGSEYVERRILLEPDGPLSVPGLRDGIARLVAAWREVGRGYTARLAPEHVADSTDYDHLARYGEWSAADPPAPERVG